MNRLYSAFLVFLFIVSCNSVFQNEQNISELIWIEVPSAERQCITPDYSTLEDAVQQLTDNDIEVYESKERNFVVCEACSCPTGIVYQAQIHEDDLSKAQDLGWMATDEGADTPD